MDKDVRQRIEILNDDLTMWGGPWGGGFWELKEHDGLAASGDDEHVYAIDQDGNLTRLQ